MTFLRGRPKRNKRKKVFEGMTLVHRFNRLGALMAVGVKIYHLLNRKVTRLSTTTLSKLTKARIVADALKFRDEVKRPQREGGGC